MCPGHRQAALDLGEEQKQRLLAARTYLLAQMVEIIQERTLIISMLQVRCRGPAWPREELQGHSLGHLSNSSTWGGFKVASCFYRAQRSHRGAAGRVQCSLSASESV